MRVAYDGVEDLKRAMPDLSPEEIARTDFGTYNAGQFLDDMARVTEFRCDPDLTEILVKRSMDTVAWMRSKGVRFTAAWAGRRSTSAASSSSGAASPSKRSAAGGAGGIAHQRREEERHRHLVLGARRGLIADDEGVQACA